MRWDPKDVVERTSAWLGRPGRDEPWRLRDVRAEVGELAVRVAWCQDPLVYEVAVPMPAGPGAEGECTGERCSHLEEWVEELGWEIDEDISSAVDGVRERRPDGSVRLSLVRPPRGPSWPYVTGVPPNRTYEHWAPLGAGVDVAVAARADGSLWCWWVAYAHDRGGGEQLGHAVVVQRDRTELVVLDVLPQVERAEEVRAALVDSCVRDLGGHGVTRVVTRLDVPARDRAPWRTEGDLRVLDPRER